KYPKEMRDLAIHIIEGKTAHFDPKMFEDRYEQALVDLVRSKQEGHEAKPASAPKPSNVVNLMDALRRSVEAEKAPKAAGKSKTAEKARSSARKPSSGGRSPGKSRSGGRSKNLKRAS